MQDQLGRVARLSVIEVVEAATPWADRRAPRLRWLTLLSQFNPLAYAAEPLQRAVLGNLAMAPPPPSE
jgi:hypothetical protein